MSGGFPMTVPTAPSSILAQTPSFRASLGQLCFVGLLIGLGLGIGLGGKQVLQPLTYAKNMRLRDRKRAAEKDLLDSIDLKVDKPQLALN